MAAGVQAAVMMRSVLYLMMLLTVNFVPVTMAQQLEATQPPAGTPRPPPYLPDTIGYRLILAAPPPVGSLQDRSDIADDIALQSVPDDRWKTANDDANYVFPRFSEALGRTLDRATLPHTIAMLNRALRDVAGPTFQAKQVFHRPRPYQRLQLARVCGLGKAPLPEINPTTGSSYPSGHSSYGWTTALLLAKLAPDRAPQLLQRATEYGQSRLICGVHFPTDIEAGRVLATAVVYRLSTNIAFRRDLACARAEFQGHATVCSDP